jgi:hypothetical protein
VLAADGEQLGHQNLAALKVVGLEKILVLVPMISLVEEQVQHQVAIGVLPLE